MLTFNPDGTVTLAIEEKTFTLRRPKLREYRGYVEELARLRLQLTERIRLAADAKKAAVEAGEEFTDDLPLTAGNNLMLDWLNVVIHGDAAGLEGLAPSAPLLTEDNVEPWVTAAGVSTEFINHWTSRPGVPGGA